MIYTAIDGYISDFLDSQLALTNNYQRAELHAYLVNAGHDEGAVLNAILAWQQHHFRQLGDSWEAFELTKAGMAAVEELRDRRR